MEDKVGVPPGDRIGAGEIGRRNVTGPGHQDHEGALRDLLDEHPTAIVGAIDADGLFVDMPASVPLRSTHRVSTARSALDLVQPADRPSIITTWVEAKARGIARTAATLTATESGAPASLHFFDLTSRHGVYIGVIVPTSKLTPVAFESLAEITTPPPRVARTRKDEISTLVAVDAATTEMLGWSESEMLGRSSLSFIHPDDQERAIDLWMECLSRPSVTFRTRVRHRHLDGRWMWIELSNRNLLADAGYVDCEMFDISEEMEAHEAVRASERLLRELTASLPVGVSQFDTERRIVYANERLYEILGAEPSTHESVLLSCVVDIEAFQQSVVEVFEGRDVNIQIEIDRLDGGGRRRCTVAMRALTDDDQIVTGGVLVVEDVTEQARMQAELEHRATYDALTGCVNRHAVLARMTQVLEERRAGGEDAARGIAAIFVDLDNFKSVNDGHGHAAGDALLVTIAERLRGAVRNVDLVGRLGGDEFLVVCPDVDDEAAAAALADRIASVVAAPVHLDGAVVRPSASVGVAWTGERDLDADTLIAEADGAMYAAKDGGGTVVMFPVPDVAESSGTGA